VSYLAAIECSGHLQEPEKDIETRLTAVFLWLAHGRADVAMQQGIRNSVNPNRQSVRMYL
jgi:hypothetical protein